MAAVHAPRHPPQPHLHQHSVSTSSASSNHSPFRRVHRATYAPPPPGKSSSASAAAASSSNSSTVVARAHHAHHAAQPAPAPPPCIDPYYGHEETSKLCSRFVSHTFNCPELLPPPPTATSSSAGRSGNAAQGNSSTIPNTLTHFVAYALHRTRLHASVVFTALALLHRLKARFPAARGSSGHRLFLAAYMLASKVVCDDTYSNKSWAVVGQGMFALREINQMEREMLGYLEWNLNIPHEDLAKFEREVRRIYSISGGRDGNGREGWGQGVEMRLTAGVGGRQPPQDCSIEESSSLTLLAIPSTAEKSPIHPHQLPTPTDAGPAAVPAPVARPILPPISTAVAKPPAYPSPPMSPASVSAALKSAMGDSDGSSASTSPIDGDSDRDESDYEDERYPSHGDGSPSPTSSEDSATLPTPPNSALSASGPHHHHRVSHGYAGYGPKMGKSHSVPGFAYASRETGRERVGRSSAPPVAVPITSKREREVPSVTASHFGQFTVANIGGVEEDGDAVMDLEDEKRGGVAYYATAHPVSVPRPASATAPPRASAPAVARKDMNTIRDRERDREIREGGRREREGRTLRTYTVPCAW